MKSKPVIWPVTRLLPSLLSTIWGFSDLSSELLRQTFLESCIISVLLWNVASFSPWDQHVQKPWHVPPTKYTIQVQVSPCTCCTSHFYLMLTLATHLATRYQDMVLTGNIEAIEENNMYCLCSNICPKFLQNKSNYKAYKFCLDNSIETSFYNRTSHMIKSSPQSFDHLVWTIIDVKKIWHVISNKTNLLEIPALPCTRTRPPDSKQLSMNCLTWTKNHLYMSFLLFIHKNLIIVLYHKVCPVGIWFQCV